MKHVGLSAMCLLIFASAANAQVRFVPHRSGSNATPAFVTCDPYIGVQYVNNAVLVSCTDEKSGQTYTFTVPENGTPSAADVIAFVQPYTMASLMMQSMPAVAGNKSAFSSFTSRVSFTLSNGQIASFKLVSD